MTPEPTDGELKILQLIWKHGPLTVREVHDLMESETGYTSTLKMMQIMNEKGMLGRKASGRSHIYHSKIDQKKTTQNRLDSFLEATFGGSASRLVMQLLGSNATNDEELEKIRDIIDEFEKNKTNES